MTIPDPRTGPVAYPLSRDVLVVDGSAAESYLQGQLSQDVAAMAPEGSAWSFALAPDGKVDAWFRISRRAHDWVIDIDAGFGEGLVARLSRFLLRTDARVERRAWSGVAVRGPGSTGLVGTGPALVADAAWPGLEGVDLLGPDVELPAGAATGGPADLEALRIECGVPAMGRELDPSTIPAASGVVDRSVSFTKGCYTGQELVARVNSRGGSAPTRLCGVLAESDVTLEPGAGLAVDSVEAGTITSTARAPWRDATVALAYVKRAVEVPSEALVELRGGARVVTVGPLPMA